MLRAHNSPVTREGEQSPSQPNPLLGTALPMVLPILIRLVLLPYFIRVCVLFLLSLGFFCRRLSSTASHCYSLLFSGSLKLLAERSQAPCYRCCWYY